MKNNIQGFTLIELLIVIAIIGILATVLIPNLLAASKKAYDSGAITCGKSIQTAEAIAYVNGSSYIPISGDMADANPTCASNTMEVQQLTQTDDDYSFTVSDKRGGRIYTFKPTSISSAPRP